MSWTQMRAGTSLTRTIWLYDRGRPTLNEVERVVI
jgi:hypothetical protein